MVTIALASLIIGEVFAGHRGGVGKRVVCVVLGSIVYRFIIALALRLNISAEYFKLVSAVIVAVAIAAPNMKGYVHLAKIKSNARKLRPCPERGTRPMLEVSHISKTFNAGTVNEKRALSDLSLRLADGEFATIVGSNGAGKSTLSSMPSPVCSMSMPAPSRSMGGTSHSCRRISAAAASATCSRTRSRAPRRT